MVQFPMPDRLVNVKLPNDTTVVVSASTVSLRRTDAEEDVADLEEIFNFDEVQKAIEGISQAVVDALSKVKPQKATVEFGIEVALETGKLTALLVKGEARGNLKISLEWSGNRYGVAMAKSFITLHPIRLMAAPISESGHWLRAGKPVALFPTNIGVYGNKQVYDVAGDGQHFLVSQASMGTEDFVVPLSIIVNLPALLERGDHVSLPPSGSSASSARP